MPDAPGPRKARFTSRPEDIERSGFAWPADDYETARVYRATSFDDGSWTWAEETQFQRIYAAHKPAPLF